MTRNGILALVATAWVVLSGCGSRNPTPTSPGGIDLAGQWTGTTYQGKPISFTISADQRVTAISVEYTFSGCSGVDTFSNLDVPVFTSPGLFFGHSTSLPGGRAVSIQVYFFADRALGSVIFYGPSACGSTGDGGPIQVAKR